MPTVRDGRPLALSMILLLTLVGTSASPGPLRARARMRAAQRSERRAAAEDRRETRAASVPPGVTARRNVPYGSGDEERMDVYLPQRPSHAPVILMVHGGGWRLGDKADSRVVENKVARWVPRGFIFVSTNYPMLPQADPVRQADEVARALAAVQASAAGWGGDPAKVVLMGHSAGAHLVALLSARPPRAYALGAQPWLGTVVLDSGALDVEHIMQRRHLPLYDDAFGVDPDYWREACPQHQLTHSALPMLVVCSTERRDDSCGASREFAAKARAQGVRVAVLPEDLRHGEVNENLGLPGEYTDAVDTFMRSLLQ